MLGDFRELLLRDPLTDICSSRASDAAGSVTTHGRAWRAWSTYAPPPGSTYGAPSWTPNASERTSWWPGPQGTACGTADGPWDGTTPWWISRTDEGKLVCGHGHPSGRASFWGDAYTVRKWTRNLRTKLRKCVPTKRNRETNDAFQKHFFHRVHQTIQRNKCCSQMMLLQSRHYVTKIIWIERWTAPRI